MKKEDIRIDTKMILLIGICVFEIVNLSNYSKFAN